MRRLPRVSKQDGAPLESAIQAQIVQALKLHQWLVWEMQKGSKGNGAVYCTAGIPDLYVFHKSGRAVWAEIKRPKTGKLSVAQLERHRELTLCGIPCVVWRSVDDALAFLQGENHVPDGK